MKPRGCALSLQLGFTKDGQRFRAVSQLNSHLRLQIGGLRSCSGPGSDAISPRITCFHFKKGSKSIKIIHRIHKLRPRCDSLEPQARQDHRVEISRGALLLLLRLLLGLKGLDLKRFDTATLELELEPRGARNVHAERVT